jgi:hypothetical protein
MAAGASPFAIGGLTLAISLLTWDSLLMGHRSIGLTLMETTSRRTVDGQLKSSKLGTRGAIGWLCFREK